MPKSSLRVLCTALIAAAVAPIAGCALFNKLLDTEESKPKPGRYVPAKMPPKTAAPVPPYTEAQWTEFTTAATRRVKEKSRVMQTYRFVGPYPNSNPQELTVKANHCYDISPEWVQTAYPTLVQVTYGKNAEGKRTNNTLGNVGEVLKHGGLMTFCADADGPATIVTTLMLADGQLPPYGRPDEVQWAAALGERPEDATQRAKRQNREWNLASSALTDDENNLHGREVGRRCRDCRSGYMFCLEELKNVDPKAAENECIKRFETCSVQVGQTSTLRPICYSPPYYSPPSRASTQSQTK